MFGNTDEAWTLCKGLWLAASAVQLSICGVTMLATRDVCTKYERHKLPDLQQFPQYLL
jgi:hypothetical protein